MALKPVRQSNAWQIALAPTGGGSGNNYYIYYGRDWGNLSADFDGYDLSGNSGDRSVHSALDPRLVDPDIDLGAGQSLIGGELQVVVDSDDYAKGTNNSEQIFVAQGDDSVEGEGGSDLIVGGDGDDTLIGGDGNDMLYGDYSNIPDYMYTFDSRRVAFWELKLPEDKDTAVSGDDLLRGGEGGDLLYGGPGNDQLEGGPRGEGNADQLTGGPGADIFYLNYDDGDDPNASSFWYDYADLATSSFAEDSVKDTLKSLADDAASEVFSSLAGGFILGGTVDVLTTSIKTGIDALFQGTEAAKQPDLPDDVMVVADFDPREDVLVLPIESGKVLTATAKTMTSPFHQNGVGIEFSTLDVPFAQVFFSPNYLDEFGLEPTDTGVTDLINNVLQTSLIIESSENPDDPDQGGIQNGIYPFPTEDDAYVDGQAPDSIEDRIAATTPPGTRTEIYGAFAPWSLVKPSVSSTTAYVAGTNMGDILNVNETSFAPEDANSSELTSTSTHVMGFGGSDIIFGGGGRDTIYGGDGDDDIYGIGQSNVEIYEKFYGEGGDDRIFLGWTSTLALADGGEDNDWVDFLYLDHPLTLDLNLTVGSGSSTNPNNGDISQYDVTNVENVAGTRLDDMITATDGDNILQGNDGNDTIVSGGGTDTASFADNSGKVVVDLSSATGDTLSTDEYGADGTAQANTVVSNDSIIGGIANLIGSDFNDSLTGDNDPNAIDGGAGDDTIRGNGGDDTLTGGADNDSITGGAGADEIDGGSGDDTITGGGGADDIDGGAGDDSIQGDDGDDTLKGGEGNDTVQGFPGNDWLEGGDGDDSLQGGNDNDTLMGDNGNDTILGNAGDDAIFWTAQQGNDVINGGADNDTLTIQTLFGFDPVFPNTQPIRLTASDDTLSIIVPIDPVMNFGDEILSVTNVETIVLAPIPDVETNDFFSVMPIVEIDSLPDTVTSIVWTGDDAGNVFDGANATTQTLILDGAGGNDSITASDGADSLQGGDGDDTITGGSGDDAIDGGANNDVIFGNGGRDTINGGDGGDQIEGGNAADVINGGAGADVIDGGNNPDTIDGGLGNDLINGGNANDSFTWAVGDGADFIAGGDDDDDLTIDADNGIGGSQTTIAVSVTPVVNLFDPGSIVTGVRFGVIPSAFEEFTMIEVENFTINADADGTTVSVAGDLSAAGVSENTVTFNGADGDDVFDGSEMTGPVRVVLNGAGGDDTLIGGSGNDLIDGGSGSNVMYGGGGIDSFVGDVEHLVDDLIGDFEAGETIVIRDHAFDVDLASIEVGAADIGIDTTGDGILDSQFSIEGDFSTLEGERFQVEQVGNDVHITLLKQVADTPIRDGGDGTPGDDFLFGSDERDFLAGREGNDVLDGNDGRDFLFGGPDNDVIRGGGDTDWVFGGSGDDFAFGGGGNDLVFGGPGNDLLNGGLGNDDMYGGPGDDTYTGTAAELDGDWIIGFGPGDKIVIDRFEFDVQVERTWFGPTDILFDKNGDGSLDGSMRVYGLYGRSLDIEQVDGDTVITLGDPEPFDGLF